MIIDQDTGIIDNTFRTSITASKLIIRTAGNTEVPECFKMIKVK